MSGKNIEVKTGGRWHFYNWEPSTGGFYQVSSGIFGKNYSKLGKASSLQDAIALAKANCDAGKSDTVEVREG